MMIAKTNKYRAKKTTIDGVSFASAIEAKRYSELKLLEREGAITALVLQPQFDLVVCGILCGRYRPDFKYFEGGKYVVEEIKGFRVRDYALRVKVFRATHPHIEFREIGVQKKRKARNHPRSVPHSAARFAGESR